MSDDRSVPRYPIYIPSKGRVDVGYTGNFLDADDVPFRFVVEPQEEEAYVARWGQHRVLALPFRDLGSVIPARNWIMEHSIAEGHARHWQLDDNMERTRRWYRGKRIPCHSGVVTRTVEDFADRFTNVAIAGLSYTMFQAKMHRVPYFQNVHVYSYCLIDNSIPFRYRGQYNEDTDLCLQAIGAGWCTVLFNAFMVDKKRTMMVRGGNTTSLYQGDGRLKMARSLERMWPGVVEVDRRWQRPQHVIKDQWRRFDNRLIPKPGVNLSALPAVDEYDLALKELRPAKNANLANLAGSFLERQRVKTE